MKLFLLTLFALFSIISTNVDYWRDEPRVGVMARDNHHTIDSEKKNVKCPLGYFKCGSECKPDEERSLYSTCTTGVGNTLYTWCWERKYLPPNIPKCNGKCIDGYSPCKKVPNHSFPHPCCRNNLWFESGSIKLSNASSEVKSCLFSSLVSMKTSLSGFLRVLSEVLFVGSDGWLKSVSRAAGGNWISGSRYTDMFYYRRKEKPLKSLYFLKH